MATGYKNIQTCKTLVLPIPDGDLYLSEYKDIYGIDLSEYIELKNNNIYFNAHGALILLQNLDTKKYGRTLFGILDSAFAVSRTVSQSYDSGVADGYLLLGAYDDTSDEVQGVRFRILADGDFSVDNLTIERITAD